MKYFIIGLLLILLYPLKPIEIEWQKMEGAPGTFTEVAILNNEICLLERTALKQTSYMYFSGDLGKTIDTLELPDKAQQFHFGDDGNILVPLSNGLSSQGLLKIQSDRSTFEVDTFLNKSYRTSFEYIGNGKFVGSEYNSHYYLIDTAKKTEEFIDCRHRANANYAWPNLCHYDEKNKAAYLFYIDNEVFRSTDHGESWDSLEIDFDLENRMGLFHNNNDMFFEKRWNVDTDNFYLTRYWNDFNEHDTIIGPKKNHDPDGFPLKTLQVSANEEQLLVALYKQELLYSSNMGETFENINKPGGKDQILGLYINNDGQMIVNAGIDLYYGDIRQSSVKTNTFSEEITPFPNPISKGDILWFENDNKHKPFNYTLVNSKGEIIRKLSEEELISNNKRTGIKIDNLSPGVYFIVQTGRNSASKSFKFIIK